VWVGQHHTDAFLKEQKRVIEKASNIREFQEDKALAEAKLTIDGVGPYDKKFLKRNDIYKFWCENPETIVSFFNEYSTKK